METLLNLWSWGKTRHLWSVIIRGVFFHFMLLFYVSILLCNLYRSHSFYLSFKCFLWWLNKYIHLPIFVATFLGIPYTKQISVWKTFKKNVKQKFKQNLKTRKFKTKIKTRYANYKRASNHQQHENDTQLWNELWKVKATIEEPVIAWKP